MLILVVISFIYTTDIFGCILIPLLEQKARAVYENLIDLTNDPDVIGPLLWLRQREIVHYNRFKELFEYYNEMLNKNKTNSQQ